MSVDEISNQGEQLTIDQNNIIYTSTTPFSGDDFFEYHITAGRDRTLNKSMI
ncbi:hypothetical protein NDQ71_10060 [Pseudoalteromonas sp. KG3]|uniref:hypothetical protein n=1 Tax=Pseudoalteromonas sp. KG3 TaxID=2951137 RepID=UPI0026587AA5|nr:hypothetical protein [Pseudoalteromonas sp. KG3]WKD22032.1 hypothetical protein NDQ71_10060 [Pseudoalteromonas sp. KG3]